MGQDKDQEMGSYWTLCAVVMKAIKDYDETGDHTKHDASETDCVRCKLNAALPPFARVGRVSGS